MDIIWGSECWSFGFQLSRTRAATNYGPNARSQYSYGSRFWDVCMRLLDGVVCSGPFRGLDDTSGKRTVHLGKPKAIRYDFGRDITLYGSHFGALATLNTMSSYGERRNLDGEHQVIHDKLVGTAVFGQKTSYKRSWRPITTTFGGQSCVVYDYEAPSLSAASGFPNPNSSKKLVGALAPELPLALAILQNYFPTSSSNDWHGNVYSSKYSFSKVLSFTFNGGDWESGFSWSYDTRVRVHVNSSAYSDYDECTFHTECAINGSGPTVSKAPNSSIGVTSPYATYGTLSLVDGSYDYYGSGRYAHGDFGSHNVSYTAESPLYCFLTGHAVGEEPNKDQIDHFLNGIRFFSNHLHVDDIASSAYASSTKAVDRWSSEFENNYIEALAEAREILSLLPDMEPFIKFLSAIPRGKWLTGALRLADFAANTYLLWKFGIEPFADELQEISEKLDTVVARLRSNSAGLRSLRGMMTHQFGVGDGYWSAFKLTTRSEVICSFPSYSTLLAILPLKLTGLDPTFSNAWDLVPFSFVVDWFFNVGGKINAGETYLHMLTSRVEGCVHSYKIEGRVTDLPFRFIPDGLDVDDVKFTKYWRTVSGYFPPPKTSRFDWLPATGAPTLVGASLLWVLVR